jgi:hypothetical protein
MSAIPATVPVTLTFEVPVGPAGPQGPAGPPGASPTLGPPFIPANAVCHGPFDKLTWKSEHDDGTPGTSSGTSAYVDAVSGRNFTFTYTGNAGQRYSIGFVVDTTYPSNFCYDIQIMFADPTEIQDMELDMNQVMADGRTVIFDCQCASGSSTWEHGGWHPSRIIGNPQQWGVEWHRIRLFWHRSADGNTTYFDGVQFDGVYTASGMAGSITAQALGWNPVGLLLANFQIDGASKTGGTVSANARNIQVWAW